MYGLLASDVLFTVLLLNELLNTVFLSSSLSLIIIHPVLYYVWGTFIPRIYIQSNVNYILKNIRADILKLYLVVAMIISVMITEAEEENYDYDYDYNYHIVTVPSKTAAAYRTWVKAGATWVAGIGWAAASTIAAISTNII